MGGRHDHPQRRVDVVARCRNYADPPNEGKHAVGAENVVPPSGLARGVGPARDQRPSLPRETLMGGQIYQIIALDAPIECIECVEVRV